MTINLNIIGKRYQSAPITYNEDAVILYALGIGAGVKELDFVYEKSLKVFPSFIPVALDQSLILSMYADVGINMPIHGEQKLVVHRPIPISGTVCISGVITSIYDKGDKGAVANFVFTSRDENNLELCESHAVILDPRAGNFGGERGPKAERIDPPGSKEPHFHVEYVTSPDQCALYRLSGDKNLHHIDPDFARKFGFDRPPLQGMCTFGFAVRAILNGACGTDPARFKSFSCRFQQVVYPGDTLITEGWKVDRGTYIVRTTTQDGRIALGNAVAEIV